MKEAQTERDEALEAVLKEMVAERGEKPRMGPHWDGARDALGRARFCCNRRDVSQDIAEMRKALAVGGFDLKAIGTSEVEIEQLIAEGKRNSDRPLTTARGQLVALKNALKRGKSRIASSALTQLQRAINDGQIPLNDIPITESQLDKLARAVAKLKGKTKASR